MSIIDEDIGHREAWELIPWLVNGRAETGDRERVEQHLAHCAACREELVFQRQLHTAMTQEVPMLADDPQPGLQRLWTRIDSGNGDTFATPERRRTIRPWQQLLVAAVLVEAIGIAALSSVIWSQNGAQGSYQTLSSPAAPIPGATIRVVLAPELTTSDLQSLLVRTHLQIVGGPSTAGAYSLAPASAAISTSAPAKVATVLAQLRTDPGVRFAEPVGAVADDASR